MNALSRSFFWVGLFASLLAAGCRGSENLPAAPTALSSGNLIAKTYDSGFADSHDTYNGISVASNGRVLLCIVFGKSRCRGADVFL